MAHVAATNNVLQKFCMIFCSEKELAEQATPTGARVPRKGLVAHHEW